MPPDGSPKDEAGAPNGGGQFLSARALEQQASKPEVVDKASELLRPYLRDPTQASNAAAQVVAVMEMHKGPMPHPRILAGYEEIIPGAAREILEMAKSEQKHRHKMENMETTYPYMALGFGFAALICCIFGSVFLAYHGTDVKICLALVGAPLLAAVGWMINSRITRPTPQPTPGPKTPATKKNTKRR